MSSRGIVENFPDGSKGYKCGYCNGEDGSLSHGMWAHSLSIQDYQNLIDRGWRRSGKYCYKPTMNKTCCPQYAIRCKVNEFQLSKSQKKVIKRFNKYLNYGIKPGESEANDHVHTVDESCDMLTNPNLTQLPAEKSLTVANASSSAVDKLEEVSTPKNIASDPSTAESSVSQNDQPTPHCTSNITSTREKSKPKAGLGADPNKPQRKKAKMIRKERWLQKQKLLGDADICLAQKKNEAKSIEDFLGEIIENPVHSLKVRLVRSNPQSKEFIETFKQAHSVYLMYQMSIHGDPQDKPTEKQYKRFLVDSPLEQPERTDGYPEGYGSFHQQYWLDGKLIAVGVIDILTHCTSSVYLYYDPEYAFLSLGTYSALREVAFTREISKHDPNVKYYYMGYYIHSCPKMKYKGAFSPSFLLCPEAYNWNAIEKCIPKLDSKKYNRFDETGKDSNLLSDIKDVGILFMRQAMTFEIYKALNPGASDGEEIKEYAQRVGKKCAKRMLLYRC